LKAKAPKDIDDIYFKLGFILGSLRREDVTDYLINEIEINELVLDQIIDGTNYIHGKLMDYANRLEQRRGEKNL